MSNTNQNEAIFAELFSDNPGGTEFKVTPEDAYIGKVVGAGINLNVERKYKDGPTKINELKFIFAVKVKDEDQDTGFRTDLVFSKGFKFSLYETGSLLKVVKTILGDKTLNKATIEEKYGKNFINEMINKEVCLDITHNTVGEKTYCNIDEITKIRKGDTSKIVDDYEVSLKLSAKYDIYFGKVATSETKKEDEILDDAENLFDN